MKLLISIVMGGILVLYPFAIYYGLNYFSPLWLSTIVLSILVLRVFFMKKNLKKMPWIMPATLLGGSTVLISTFTNSYIGFKIYPVMVNLAMLGVFLYSYFKPPTIIETFARIREPELSTHAVNYISGVTLIWCLFFVFNACVAAYTAFFTSLEIWMLYNGFISYLLMGALMAIEFIVRLQVKKRHAKKEAALNV